MSIKIENTQVFGWEAAIRGARNPMNSWEKSDSEFYNEPAEDFPHDILAGLKKIGPNDHKLLMNLCKGGTEESKWRRMVHVQMDVTAPLYWWKEFETYKVGSVSNSCSTMHKIQAKEFTLDDFSCEHLIMDFDYPDDVTDEEQWQKFLDDYCAYDCCPEHPAIDGLICEYDAGQVLPGYMLDWTIAMLNRARYLFLETKDKKYWWQMIQLLPSSYNQKRTIDLNYEVLASQYRQRKGHKLTEWAKYLEWIRSLPYSEFITMEN